MLIKICADIYPTTEDQKQTKTEEKKKKQNWRKRKKKKKLAPNLELVWRGQFQFLPEFLRGPGTQPVEDVVVTLILALGADTRLLQQVVRDETATHHVLKQNQVNSRVSLNYLLEI